VGQSTSALEGKVRNQQMFANPSGKHATYSTRDGKYLDSGNEFFQSLGTNGRSCSSCHTPGSGFSVSAAEVQQRFDATDGTDPIFRTVDGSNNPNADVSTVEARRAAYSLLLNKGLIRIQLKIPATAQFELFAVDDPYGNDTTNGLSVFRRPLPASNLKFVESIMWDGREPSLTSQARNATLGHAEAGASPTDAQLASIVSFETALFTTQVLNYEAGQTDSAHATGDPVTLSSQPFATNLNRDATTNGGIGLVDHDVFKVFNAWANKDGAKAAVARGQNVFNNRLFVDPKAGNISCANCHNAPNSGSFDGPTTEPAPPFGGFPTVLVAAPQFRTPDLPLYTLRVKATGQLIQTTDPAMAFQTGLVRDIGRFKVPHLRGLASRAPYFHNGKSATLGDVVDHYDTVFSIHFTAQERSDLIAFLGSI